MLLGSSNVWGAGGGDSAQDLITFSGSYLLGFWRRRRRRRHCRRHPFPTTFAWERVEGGEKAFERPFHPFPTRFFRPFFLPFSPWLLQDGRLRLFFLCGRDDDLNFFFFYFLFFSPSFILFQFFYFWIKLFPKFFVQKKFEVKFI